MYLLRIHQKLNHHQAKTKCFQTIIDHKIHRIQVEQETLHETDPQYVEIIRVEPLPDQSVIQKYEILLAWGLYAVYQRAFQHDHQTDQL